MVGIDNACQQLRRGKPVLLHIGFEITLRLVSILPRHLLVYDVHLLHHHLKILLPLSKPLNLHVSLLQRPLLLLDNLRQILCHILVSVLVTSIKANFLQPFPHLLNLLRLLRQLQRELFNLRLRRRQLMHISQLLLLVEHVCQVVDATEETVGGVVPELLVLFQVAFQFDVQSL